MPGVVKVNTYPWNWRSRGWFRAVAFEIQTIVVFKMPLCRKIIPLFEYPSL